jgi:hypothetical protein
LMVGGMGCYGLIHGMQALYHWPSGHF